MRLKPLVNKLIVQYFTWLLLVKPVGASFLIRSNIMRLFSTENIYISFSDKLYKYKTIFWSDIIPIIQECFLGVYLAFIPLMISTFEKRNRRICLSGFTKIANGV